MYCRSEMRNDANLSENYKFPIIGVTGSIASGKSTFAAALADCGATVIDADDLARTVISPESNCFKAAVAHFGSTIVANGKLDRAALAKIVFSDDGERRWLEQLLHPQIRAVFLSRLSELALATPQPSLVVYVAPLLFEAGVPEVIENVVLVTAHRDVLIQRAVARGLRASDAEARLNHQMPDAEKRKLADIIVENNGSVAELREAARRLYQTVTTKTRETS